MGGFDFDHRYRDGDAAVYLKFVAERAKDMPALRTFETGATRDTDDGKHDYEGYLSPLVIQRFGEYMTKHRIQVDGAVRDSDNWQKGIPPDAYIKSAFRHFVDWWLWHRGSKGKELLEEALCGLLFNVAGYLHERLAHQVASTNEDGKESIKSECGEPDSGQCYIRPAGFASDLVPRDTGYTHAGGTSRVDAVATPRDRDEDDVPF